MIGTTAAIILGASAIGSKVVAAKMASKASKDAANIQSASADKALAYNQQATDQSLDFLRTNQDRANAGGPSAPRSALGQLLGLNPTAAGGGAYSPMPPTNTAPITGAIPRPTASPFTMPGQTPQGGMVLMRAPNGQTKQVRAADVEHYKQAIGAVVVQ